MTQEPATGTDRTEQNKSGGGNGIERYGSGGRWEERWGYSRVVAAGPLVWTAGCTAVVDGQVQSPRDPAGQTRIAIEIGLAALAQAGVRPDQVVATRMYITDPDHAEAVGAMHGLMFRDARPVSTMVVVAGLVDPQMLVEIELTAWCAS